MCFRHRNKFGKELLANNPSHYDHIQGELGSDIWAAHQYLVESFLVKYKINPKVLFRLLIGGSEKSNEIIDALWDKVIDFTYLNYPNLMDVSFANVLKNARPGRKEILMNELLDLVETPPEKIEYS